METQLTRKSQAQVHYMAAAHHNSFSKERSGFFLEDNRKSSQKQQQLVDKIHAATTIQRKPNTTGLPDKLKSGIENLSGHSLDDVKVHYNSSKPAQLNAHAYAQGNAIHLASGQEKHLPHEAWHVVQQKQGRVQPTTTVNGAKINDSSGLEKEADVMGSKALQLKENTATKLTTTTVSNPTIQRFTIVQPDDYQKAGEAQETMFPQQRLDQHRTSNVAHGYHNITEHVNWVQEYNNTPALKVSQHGLLAVHSTTSQPKAFYGLESHIANFRQKLIDIKSRITLKISGGSKVRVPANPEHIGEASHLLSKVVPELSPHMDQREQLMDNSECDSVSQAIVHGKEMVVGNTREGTRRIGSVSVRGNEIANVAKGAANQQRGQTIDDFVTHTQQANQNKVDLRDENRAISPEVQNYFAYGFFRRRHLVPDDRILRALSAPGVPRAVWKQVYELHVRKTEEQRPHHMDIIPHIEKVLKMQDLQQYQQVIPKNHIQGQLGINAHASPEVGESFSTMGQGGPAVTDEDGAITHELDVANTTPQNLQAVLTAMLSLQSSALRLGTLSHQQYQIAKGMVPYAEHHGAVVAKDGDDSVTFENYNRAVEADTIKSDLWNKLFAEFDRFDKNIKQEVQDIRAAMQQSKQDETLDPYSKASQIFNLKRAHIELLRKHFLVVTSTVSLNIKTNLGEGNNSLWYFQMYGPVSKTFIDAKGNRKQQSFHDTWKSSVPNAVTVRTTSLASAYFKKEIIDDMKYRIGELAYNMIKRGDFRHVPTIFQQIQTIILAPIAQAQTRIQVADALPGIRARLQRMEDNFPDLEAPEKQEARNLVDKNIQNIRIQTIGLRRKIKQEQDVVKYHQGMAERLRVSHPDLSQRATSSANSAMYKAQVLQQKLNFLLAFINA